MSSRSFVVYKLILVELSFKTFLSWWYLTSYLWLSYILLVFLWNSKFAFHFPLLLQNNLGFDVGLLFTLIIGFRIIGFLLLLLKTRRKTIKQVDWKPGGDGRQKFQAGEPGSARRGCVTDGREERVEKWMAGDADGVEEWDADMRRDGRRACLDKEVSILLVM